MDGLTSTPAQRWLARLSFVLAGLVIVILMVFAGLKSLAAVVVSLAAAYFFLSRRGIWHWLSLADWHMPEHPAQPPARHPYLIMNPNSGVGNIEAPRRFWCPTIRTEPGPGCGTSPAFRNVRRGHRIDRR